ncbi:MAG TPA: cytochrome c3 family protein [Candidatus Binataceae bacterium]|nr:cytochrome c3 family protein [Candidatus Binataceae bacterium]
MVRDKEQSGICVFCHTPHNAKPLRALWNRDLPPVSYKLYQSSTMEAALNQPTGSSRLCLSCHDGVIALSKLRLVPADTKLNLPALTGKTLFGTDLSGSHPISFVYDSNLALRQGELVDPAALPRAVRLDDTQQLQCTTCHDPHQDQLPNFLRVDNRFSAQCVMCHRITDWPTSSHATSTAHWQGGGQSPWLPDAYPTVAENGCLNCHRTHAAAHPEWLMAQANEPANCTICHDGTMAQANIAQQFLKPSRHPIVSRQWTHKPNEDPITMARHVTCVDCHNPHATSNAASADEAHIANQLVLISSGSLRGVEGVNIAGSVVNQANYEYEICLKCHGLIEPTTPGILRQETTRNIRLRIGPSSRSHHPIALPSEDVTLAGLEAGYTASSMISCVDCHNSDQWRPNGSSPRGPHGSRWEPILAEQYETEDPSMESPVSYALCYRCHSRSVLISGTSGFPHAKHVIEQRASCAVCHDAHGSPRNRSLIDFMVMTETGVRVVKPSSSGRFEFDPDPGRPGHGSCYLTCHGANHNPKRY